MVGSDPCTDWTVHQLVNHLVGMNLVFAALLSKQAPPERSADRLGPDPVGAYRESGSALTSAFDQPGVLERTYQSPLGAATGRDRLRMRLYDLLVHGWDLAQATGQPSVLPATWPSRHWRSPRYNSPRSRVPADLLLPKPSRMTHPPSIDWPPFWVAPSASREGWHDACFLLNEE